MLDFTLDELRKENEVLRDKIEQSAALATAAKALVNMWRGKMGHGEGTVLEGELAARGLRLETAAYETNDTSASNASYFIKGFMKGREINEPA